jgi:hypothetical protein
LSCGLKRYDEPLRHPPGQPRLRGIAAYTRPSLPEHRSAGPGPGRASPAPASTMRPFRSPYPGRFLTAALPGSSRRPWPSPRIPGLGSPLSPEGAKITGRQDSHHATDRPLAHPQRALDAGLRHRAFPPDAASLLPGALAPTGTGLPPAGRCELMFRSGHIQAPPPNAGHTHHSSRRRACYCSRDASSGSPLNAVHCTSGVRALGARGHEIRRPARCCPRLGHR